jgi:hypothetical protein
VDHAAGREIREAKLKSAAAIGDRLESVVEVDAGSTLARLPDDPEAALRYSRDRHVNLSRRPLGQQQCNAGGRQPAQTSQFRHFHQPGPI